MILRLAIKNDDWLKSWLASLVCDSPNYGVKL
jgi:hypothetical protein